MSDETSTAALQEYYKLINAGGNHYDIGRKMTDAFTERLHKRLSTPPDRQKLDFATKSMETAFGVHPVLKDELQGIAEGISIDFESMLVEASDYSASPTHSMTLLAKKGDGLLIGRAFSANPDTYVRNLLRLDPNDSYASLGRMSGYFAGTWESIGVYGQFVCADILASSASPTDGVAAYMIPRIVTEASKSVESAVDKLSSIKPMHDSSYVVAGSGGAHLLTYEKGEMKSQEIGSYPLLLVDGRPAAGKNVDASDLAGVKAFLANHENGGCLHTGDLETIYALVIDMATEEIEYTTGPPCKSEFGSVDWPGGYG